MERVAIVVLHSCQLSGIGRSEICSQKMFLGLLGGSGGMLPQKILKMIPPRLAEIDAPGI